MATKKFIVVFKDNVTKEQVQQYAKDVDTNGGKVSQVYDSLLNGFAAEIPEEHLQSLQSLQSEGIIDYIEPDGVVTTQ